MPLIGGMALANYRVTGEKPVAVLSYGAFAKNESNLHNYWPDENYYLLDEETNTLKEKIEFGHIDFVSSVCPCAGMSCLNTATRSCDNETNNWLYKVADFTLGTIKPDVYWGENAPGLYSEQNASVIEKLRGYCKKYGYTFSIIKTDTYLHGIPQHRVRTFFFCWKGNRTPLISWRNEKSEPFRTWILDKNKGIQSDHWFLNPNPFELYPEMYWLMERNSLNTYSDYVNMFYELDEKYPQYSLKTPYDYIQKFDLWAEYRSWLEKYPYKDRPEAENGSRTPWYYVNYRWDKVKKGMGYFARQPIVYKDATNAIISKNMHFILHPVESRFLSTREIMALMGLPDDFELISNNLQNVTQNVPVKTASDITEEVVKYLNGDLEMTNSDFVMQNNMTQKIDHIERTVYTLF